MTDEITRRWEDGIPHDPRSEELYESIAIIDWEEGDDFFCFKSGGDGDNGEHLMYLLDIHFAREDLSPWCPTCHATHQSGCICGITRIKP
jgi:hypothetical protein